jgi:flagellar hook-length control protein FliK
MNVTSLSTAPKASASKPIEGGTQTASENQDKPTDFANALKDHETLLKEETQSKTEQPTSQPGIEKQPQTAVEQTNAADDSQALAALLEKFLPQLTENSAQQSAADVVIEPTVLATAEEPTVVTAPDTLPVAITPEQDMSSVLAATGLVFTKPTPESVNLNTPKESMPAEVTLQKAPVVFSQSAQSSQSLSMPATEGTDTFKQALATQIDPEQKIPEARTEIMPNQKPVDIRMDNPTITKPISHPGWSRDLGEHIIWMNNKEISAAEIKLNPPHLGPISVRIDVTHDNQTSILFTAQHAETKEVLETSLPKLKEMLQGQQLNLVNVNISQNSSSNQGHTAPRPFLGAPGNQDNQHLEAAPNTLEINESNSLTSKGLLSLYA